MQEEEFLSLSDAKDILDILYLVNCLIQSDGNITRVAEELGLGRRTIYDLMSRLGISFNDGKICIELTPLLRHIELKAVNIERHLSG